jgi:hypothetical protein
MLLAEMREQVGHRGLFGQADGQTGMTNKLGQASAQANIDIHLKLSYGVSALINRTEPGVGESKITKLSIRPRIMPEEARRVKEGFVRLKKSLERGDF